MLGVPCGSAKPKQNEMFSLDYAFYNESVFLSWFPIEYAIL